MTAKEASKQVSTYYGAEDRAEHERMRKWMEENLIPVIDCASSEGFCWAVFNLPSYVSRKYLKNLLHQMGYRVRNYRNGISVEW